MIAPRPPAPAADRRSRAACAPAAAPPGLLLVAPGQLAPRRWGWVLNLNRITCHAGHRVAMHRNLTEAGFLECPTCRALCYVFVPPAFGGVRRLWAADVSQEERDWINDQGLAFDQVIAHLGAEFPVARAAHLR